MEWGDGGHGEEREGKNFQRVRKLNIQYGLRWKGIWKRNKKNYDIIRIKRDRTSGADQHPEGNYSSTYSEPLGSSSHTKKRPLPRDDGNGLYSVRIIREKSMKRKKKTLWGRRQCVAGKSSVAAWPVNLIKTRRLVEIHIVFENERDGEIADRKRKEKKRHIGLREKKRVAQGVQPEK
jgi:hypothetical protein